MAVKPVHKRSKRVELTQEFVQNLFIYDKGKLFWRNRPHTEFATQRACSTWNSRYAGKEAGTLRKDGYRLVAINNRHYLVHRVIFVWHNNYLPKLIDHINGDPSDCRIENLREATRNQNNYNSRRHSDNLSGYKGVDWHESNQAYRARIIVKGVVKFLGYYDTAEQAYEAYCKASVLYHKEFGRIE